MTPCTVACQVSHSWDFWARNTGLVAICFSRGSPWPRDQTTSPALARWILCHWATRAAHKVERVLCLLDIQYNSRCFHHEWRREEIRDSRFATQIIILNHKSMYSDIYYTWSDYIKKILSLFLRPLACDKLTNAAKMVTEHTSSCGIQARTHNYLLPYWMSPLCK